MGIIADLHGCILTVNYNKMSGLYKRSGSRLDTSYKPLHRHRNI